MTIHNKTNRRVSSKKKIKSIHKTRYSKTRYSKNKFGGVSQEDANEMLFEAVEYDDMEKIDIAMSEGADIDSLNMFDYTPLMVAVSTSKSIDLIRHLIHIGADINASDDANGGTSLMFAVQQLNIDVIRLLLFNDIDINMVNNYGQNVLSLLLAFPPRGILQQIQGKRVEIIQLFNSYISEQIMDSNTDEIRYKFFNSRDNDTYTPLMLIAGQPDRIPTIIDGVQTTEASDIAIKLINYGADKSLQNAFGQTAYDIARSTDKDEYLIDLLRPDELPIENLTASIPIMSKDVYNNCDKDDEGNIYDAISQEELLREHAVKLDDTTNYCYDRINLLNWIKRNLDNPTNPMTRETIDREWIRHMYPRGIQYDYSNVTLNGGKRKKRDQTKRRKYKRKQKKTYRHKNK